MDSTHRVIWLTGLPASGKSTLARALAEQAGFEVLDGDEVRDVVRNHDFSVEGRERHLLYMAHAASRLARHVSVACAFVTPMERTRRTILDLLPAGSLMVHVSTPLAVCEGRDPRGLYARARRGEIRDFTGVGAPFEPPRCAHVEVDCSTGGAAAIRRHVETLTSHVGNARPRPGSLRRA